MAGKGLFNKLVDTFNSLADDARRQVAPTGERAKAPDSIGDSESARDSPLDSARRVAMESGRAGGFDDARRMGADGVRQSAPDTVECRFCKTPNPLGAACAGCGATPGR